MVRWFGNFKLELGNLNRHRDLASFHEVVAMAIYYHNHERIHPSLKISPADYAARLKEQSQRFKSLERVLQKTGAWTTNYRETIRLRRNCQKQQPFRCRLPVSR